MSQLYLRELTIRLSTYSGKLEGAAWARPAHGEFSKALRSREVSLAAIFYGLQCAVHLSIAMHRLLSFYSFLSAQSRSENRRATLS